MCLIPENTDTYSNEIILCTQTSRKKAVLPWQLMFLICHIFHLLLGVLPLPRNGYPTLIPGHVVDHGISSDLPKLDRLLTHGPVKAFSGW